MLSMILHQTHQLRLRIGDVCLLAMVVNTIKPVMITCRRYEKGFPLKK